MLMCQLVFVLPSFFSLHLTCFLLRANQHLLESQVGLKKSFSFRHQEKKILKLPMFLQKKFNHKTFIETFQSTMMTHCVERPDYVWVEILAGKKKTLLHHQLLHIIKEWRGLQGRLHGMSHQTPPTLPQVHFTCHKPCPSSSITSCHINLS